MQIYSIETIPGKKNFQVLGLVSGNSVRAKHLGKDLVAGFKQIVGGEISDYTEMMQEARLQATRRMERMAEDLGANAVIGVRYSSSDIMGAAAEVLCYGTAVKF